MSVNSEANWVVRNAKGTNAGGALRSPRLSLDADA